MFLWYNSFQTKFEIDTYLELSNNMSLCMGCMQEIGDNKICPSCGFDTTEKQQAPFLPYGTILQNRYIVGAGIDTNGESTRYISHDKQTGDIVIICEFLPIGLFSREEGTTEVMKTALYIINSRTIFLTITGFFQNSVSFPLL